MTFNAKKDGYFTVLYVDGDIKTTDAESFQDVLLTTLEKNNKLIIDLSGVTYTCSAGLRALLAAQQYVDESNGALTLRNVCSEIMSVFKVTGFINVLSIE